MPQHQLLRRGFLYWYDRIEKGIFRSGLDGSEPVQLVNTSSIGTVGKYTIAHIKRW